ncbi:MAG TPA: O-antigen ligase family protein [Xanthobacteraceae bacterium]|nr:O-antigen ligase family protein [Xanthobacteraceae bacterium]
MATVLDTYAPVAHPPRLHASLETLRGALLWLTGLFGAFVFVEPSPYEIASLLAIIAFVATGLSLTPALMPLAILLVLYNVGFAIAVVPVLDQPKTLLWVLVSCYLGTTALFFAAMLGRNTQARLSLLLRGYSAAAALAALAGIVGYFRLLPGADLFLLYDRARGTFNDPNVLGAFMVLPALLAFQRVLSGRLGESMHAGALLMLLLAALFLSFSRGAWGQFAAAAIVMMGLTFVTTQSTRERARIVLFAAIGALAIAAFVVALLSIEQVAGLFKERASLEQSYDVGHTGRFGRHVLGFMMALDHPFGIGPLQFRTFFPEDPHNAYLNAFTSGGWLSGFVYLALTAISLVMGLRCAFITTPWRPVYLAVYAAYVGIAWESAIIDSDHWRHYFLILGVLWGLMGASRTYAARQRRQPQRQTSPT